MMKTLELNRFQLSTNLSTSRNIQVALMLLAIFALSMYAQESFGTLAAEDAVAELNTLTAESKKLVKNICYVAGVGSVAVGTIWTIGSQSLKVACGALAITVLAFKSAAFFGASILI